jgi:hypothetical protein
MLKNATVALSYRMAGAQLTYGKYEYKERTTNGSLLEEDRRLFVTKRPKYSECTMTVNLSESFVNNAISDDARPDREESFRAFSMWRKFTEVERLHWHIAKYVMDCGSSDFKYQIIIL